MSADTFDFELGVEVSTPVKATGRVKPGELRAAKVARTVYRGPYEGLPAAWGEFSSGSNPMDMNKPTTCGSCIPSGHNRRPIQRDGAPS